MSRVPRITAAVIVLNEERNLPGLLTRLDWVDEIVLVDGGSQDGSVRLARTSGCRVLQRPFDTFARQRNYALDQATGDWVFSIDADERPTPALVAEIRARIADDRCVAYRVPIRSTIFGCPFRYCGTQDDRPIRLFRRGAVRWTGDVHEVLQVSGPVGRLDAWLEHHTIPDLPAFWAKMDRYTRLEAAARVAAGRCPRVRDAWLAPAREVFRRLIWKKGLLDGPAGWTFSLLSGYSEWVLARRHRQLWQSSLSLPEGEGGASGATGVSPVLFCCGLPSPIPINLEQHTEPETQAASPGSEALAGRQWHPGLLPLVLEGVPRGLRQALVQEGIPFVDRRPGTPQGRFVLFDSRAGACESLAAGQVAIDVHPLRQAFEEDPFQALVDQRSGRFLWQIAQFELTEEIARVDKRAVRRRLLGMLRKKLERQGGVWLRVAAFPFPYRSAFNFRLDHDHYDPADFATTQDALAGHEQATSHYICGAAYASAGEALARLRGLDVGSHGYRHHTYRTVEENLQNVRRGIDVLRAAGIEPAGFVAPHGRFNRALLAALETLGIRYSSEFALAYDELPLEVGTAGVLQIPVHPLCLELFIEAAGRIAEAESRPADLATAVEAAAGYLAELAQVKYQLGEPVFLYGHPKGKAGGLTQVLDWVFRTVDGFDAIWPTTLGRFHDWWRTRGQVRVKVNARHGELTVTAEGPWADYRVAMEYVRGEYVASIPLDKPVLSFSPETLVYQRRTAPPTIAPLAIDSPGGLRGHVRRLIDWELETPVEEIPASTWRNLAKRTLRQWWKT